MSMNLLHEEFRLLLMLRSRVKTWLTLCSACLLISIAAMGVGGWQLASLNRQTETVRQRIEPLERQQSQIARLETQRARLEKQTVATENLLPPDPTLPVLGMIAQSAAATTGDVQTLRFHLQSDGRVPTSQTAAATATPVSASPLRIQVSLHGWASSDAALSQFVAQLRSYEVFAKVDLRSSSDAPSGASGGRHFHLELVH